MSNKESIRTQEDRVSRYILLYASGNLIVSTINFITITTLEEFSYSWMIATLSAILLASYCWWGHYDLKRYRTLKDCFDDWNSGKRTYEEIYPTLVKYTPKGGILVQSKGKL